MTRAPRACPREGGGHSARLRRTRRLEADVRGAHPRRRALARPQDDPVRAASVESHPRRARWRSRRANRSGREPNRHRIPNPFIQQEPDLTPPRLQAAQLRSHFWPTNGLCMLSSVLSTGFSARPTDSIPHNLYGTVPRMSLMCPARCKPVQSRAKIVIFRRTIHFLAHAAPILTLAVTGQRSLRFHCPSKLWHGPIGSPGTVFIAVQLRLGRGDATVADRCCGCGLGRSKIRHFFVARCLLSRSK
jgi:hypothetical protein